MPIEQNYRNHQIRLPRSIVCLANEPLFISFCKEILIFLDVCIIIPGKFTLRFLYLQNISLISIINLRNHYSKPSFSIVLLNAPWWHRAFCPPWTAPWWHRAFCPPWTAPWCHHAFAHRAFCSAYCD